jgi:hypothetical protein
MQKALMDPAPRNSRIRPSLLVLGLGVIAFFLGLIVWVTVGEKPNATASDPVTQSAGQEGSVPARSAGGPSDPRMSTGTK